MTLEQLARFCERPEGGRQERFPAPFSHGVWSLATDGRLLLRVPRMEEAQEITGGLKEPHNVTDLFTPLDGQAPVPIQVLPTQPCKNCAETGIFTCHVCQHSDTCPACWGTGRHGDATPVQVGSEKFQCEYLRRLQTLPGLKFYPEHDPLGPARFTFDGGDGVLMPILSR